MLPLRQYDFFLILFIHILLLKNFQVLKVRNILVKPSLYTASILTYKKPPIAEWFLLFSNPPKTPQTGDPREWHRVLFV